MPCRRARLIPHPYSLSLCRDPSRQNIMLMSCIWSRMMPRLQGTSGCCSRVSACAFKTGVYLRAPAILLKCTCQSRRLWLRHDPCVPLLFSTQGNIASCLHTMSGCTFCGKFCGISVSMYQLTIVDSTSSREFSQTPEKSSCSALTAIQRGNVHLMTWLAYSSCARLTCW